ncbi:MAG: DUF2298 domain-containing protein [Anaerolineales bacterium]|nr:DUF2298 domain-containing protein [Anaerolineales bacterium]
MGAFLWWWLLISLIGLLAWPITWRVFGGLQDRGYGFARITGLLLTGFVFWLAGSFQLIRVNTGGALIALLVVLMLAVFEIRMCQEEMISWMRKNRQHIIATEIVFLIAFALWAFVRANNPEISGTEKPMELAFLNAIIDSDIFPARDPWLSGYAISYYYFGYVILAMLGLLSGVVAGVAFNLGNALWFALVAVGTYSLLYNLLAWKTRTAVKPAVPLLGPLFVLITGNLEGILDVLHARHVFWRLDESGAMVSRFWTWIGLENLENPPFGDPSWIPQRNWWWWRASRVIRDLDLQGNPIDLQSIDEFPFFSFLLADNHPHLLAIPFVLLAVAFALQIFSRTAPLSNRKPFSAISDRTRNSLLLLAGAGLLLVIPISINSSASQGMTPGGVVLSVITDIVLYGVLAAALGFVFLVLLGYGQSVLGVQELVAGGLIFGSLAFLNTWDFPIYLSFLFAVLVLKSGEQKLIDAARAAMTSTFSVLILGVIFFLPWYPTFASQAGGILPHVLHPTRFLHFFIMFGTALVPIMVWLWRKFIQRTGKRDWLRLVALTLGLPITLLALSLVLARLIFSFIDPFILDRAFTLMQASSFGEAVRMMIQTRVTASWTAWALGMIFAAGILLLRRQWPQHEDADPDMFVILMILIGALLILGPEFFYLRDQFGLRMNTIFKFYFAAWILWGLAAAYAVTMLWRVRAGRFWPVKILVVVPLLLGLVYPLLGTWTKTNGFNPPSGRTLNGSMHPAYAQPSDREAVAWIEANIADGVIAEAVGGSYTYYGRVSAHTGLPTVLGWPGHESQWRGGYQEVGSREGDIRSLYSSPDWAQTEEIMRRYDISYVYLGELERHTYRPLYEAKFETYMDLVYQNDLVKIFAARERGVR